MEVELATKRQIDVLEHASAIMKALSQGVLLTTKAEGRVNSMTISWGMLGIEWAKPQFITFVRQNRFTKRNLDMNPEFTINAPLEGRPYNRSILGMCGSKSGRDMDKISSLGLTLIEPSVITVPAIKELPLTLECRVVYSQEQVLENIAEPARGKYYPQDVDGLFPGSNRDIHTAYYGQIVAAYILD